MSKLPSADLRLSKYPLFRERDLANAQTQLSRAFCPLRLELRDSSLLLDVRQNRVQRDGMSLNFLSYGAEVSTELGMLEGFYLLQLPLTGRACTSVSRHVIEECVEHGSLLSPTLDVSMVWSNGCQKLLLQIARQKIDSYFEALLDRSMRSQHLVFEPSFPMLGIHARVVQLVDLWCWDLDYGDGMFFKGPAGALMRDAFLEALLRSQPHNYSSLLAQPAAAIAPRHVRRAEDFMRHHLDQEISLADVARASGVSLRALQSGFQRYRSISPSASLRAMRMEAAHHELISGAATSVTSVALKWGFAHLGRFSMAYSAKYGSTPSDVHRSHRSPQPRSTSVGCSVLRHRSPN